MLKKLKEKKLINYEKYGKIYLKTVSKKKDIEVVRKHRLWETFLYEKLHLIPTKLQFFIQKCLP